MVSNEELERAIAECKSSPDSFQNCEKLAVFLYLKERLYTVKEEIPTPKAERFSGSEFLNAVGDKNISQIMPVLDELMVVVHDLIPNLYRATIEKIESIS